jgi:hypothetical protein
MVLKKRFTNLGSLIGRPSGERDSLDQTCPQELTLRFQYKRTASLMGMPIRQRPMPQEVWWVVVIAPAWNCADHTIEALL